MPAGFSNGMGQGFNSTQYHPSQYSEHTNGFANTGFTYSNAGFNPHLESLGQFPQYTATVPPAQIYPAYQPMTAFAETMHIPQIQAVLHLQNPENKAVKEAAEKPEIIHVNQYLLQPKPANSVNRQGFNAYSIELETQKSQEANPAASETPQASSAARHKDHNRRSAYRIVKGSQQQTVPADLLKFGEKSGLKLSGDQIKKRIALKLKVEKAFELSNKAVSENQVVVPKPIIKKSLPEQATPQTGQQMLPPFRTPLPQVQALSPDEQFQQTTDFMDHARLQHSILQEVVNGFDQQPFTVMNQQTVNVAQPFNELPGTVAPLFQPEQLMAGFDMLYPLPADTGFHQPELAQEQLPVPFQPQFKYPSEMASAIRNGTYMPLPANPVQLSKEYLNHVTSSIAAGFEAEIPVAESNYPQPPAETQPVLQAEPQFIAAEVPVNEFYKEAQKNAGVNLIPQNKVETNFRFLMPGLPNNFRPAINAYRQTIIGSSLPPDGA